MRILRDVFGLLISSRILSAVMLLLLVFVGWETGSWYGKTVSVTEPLGNALTLSIYLFIIMMFVSYEFSRKLYNNGVSEAVSVTSAGRKRKNSTMAFCGLSIYSCIMSLIYVFSIDKSDISE